MDCGDVLKSEYEQLMAESRLHNNTASAIVSLEVTSLGVGVPLGLSFPYVLPAVVGITLVLWLRYLDHVAGMYRIAAYIASHLRPALADITGDRRVLQWEVFFRKLRNRPATKSEMPTERGERILGMAYTACLFGITPPVLIAAFLFREMSSQSFNAATLIATGVCSLALWLFCMLRWWLTRDWLKRINVWVENQDRLPTSTSQATSDETPLSADH